MNFAVSLFTELFGASATPANVTAACIFVTLGALLNILIEVSGRNKESQRTPEKFSFSFFLQDNWKRISLTALVCIIGVMVGNELIEFLGVYIPENLARLTPLVIGILSDYIPMKIKQKIYENQKQ